MDGPAAPAFGSFLAQRATHLGDAGQVAQIVAALWGDIAEVLSPVIGQRGVAALYKRSLYLAAESRSWPGAAALSGGVPDMDLDLLRAELARCPPGQAAAAGAALLTSFHSLVASLIGSSLSEQLLGGVWAKLFSGSSAQDPPS